MGESELMARVRQATLELPGSRKTIASFLLREGSGIAKLSMAEVADLAFTSKPSLVRFAKAMGFSGWRDFRLAFVVAASECEQDKLTQTEVDPNHPFVPEDPITTVVNNVLTLEQQALSEAVADIDVDMLAEAAQRVRSANNLVFLGTPPNRYFGMLFAYKMSQVGITCYVPTWNEWRIVARGLGPKDCAIICSYSGNGPMREPVSFAKYLREADVPIVAITNAGNNWLREQCDCVLSYQPREHYYSKIAGFYSEQCMHFALDALFSAVFLENYDRNEIRKLQAVIAYERSHHQGIVDVLPS